MFSFCIWFWLGPVSSHLAYGINTSSHCSLRFSALIEFASFHNQRDTIQNSNHVYFSCKLSLSFDFFFSLKEIRWWPRQASSPFRGPKRFTKVFLPPLAAIVRFTSSRNRILNVPCDNCVEQLVHYYYKFSCEPRIRTRRNQGLLWKETNRKYGHSWEKENKECRNARNAILTSERELLNRSGNYQGE